MARIFSTSGVHTGTELFKTPLIAGLRRRKYDVRPYVELQTMVAATVHPSDSLTKAVPATTQKPTSGSPKKISIKGMMPFGISRRLRTKINPAKADAIQGTRNMPIVDTIFEVPYCSADIGRLIM